MTVYDFSACLLGSGLCLRDSIMGGDAVGMSTVPEVIVARHCGIRVFGVSIITDLGGFDNPVEVSHEEVQQAAATAQPKMTTIMREIIARS